MCEFDDNFASRLRCFQCGTPRGGGTAGGSGGLRSWATLSGGGVLRGGGAATGAPTARHAGGPAKETSALGRISAIGPPNAGLRPQATWATAKGAARDRYDGPIGADGRRPLLTSSWAGIAARRPVPPLAEAATSEGAAEKGKGAGKGGKGSGGGGGTEARTAPIIDAEGYQMVVGGSRGRRGPPRPGLGTNVVPPTEGSPSPEDEEQRQPRDDLQQQQHQQQQQQRRWQHQHQGATDTNISSDAQDGAAEEHDGQAQAPSSDDLKEQWNREERVANFLREEGYEEHDPIRAAAEERAAAAKAAWQQSTPGAAITSRLCWAEKALLRVKKAQARAEQSIAELDDQYERERAVRMQRLHDLRAKTKEKEEKLAEISRLAADVFQPPEDETPLRDAMGAIDGPIRDAVQEALEQAPEGSALRTRLEGALGTLTDLGGLVRKVARPRWADVYDIAEGDGDEQWWHAEGAWHEHGGGGGGDWQAHGGGWDGWGPQRSDNSHFQTHEPYDDGDMDTGDIQIPYWMHSGQHGRDDSGTQWGAPFWKRGRRAHESPYGTQGRYADDDEVTMDNASAAAASASPAPADAGSGGSEEAAGAAAAAAAALERRKQEVWDLAQEEGAVVSCEQIASMDAATLEEWASTNLTNL